MLNSHPEVEHILSERSTGMVENGSRVGPGGETLVFVSVLEDADYLLSL